MEGSGSRRARGKVLSGLGRGVGLFDLGLLVLQSFLRGFEHGFKPLGIMDGHVGQHLAVEFDASGFAAFHETAVGQAVIAARRVNPLDPKVAERALAVFAVPVVVFEGLADGIFGRCD